MDEIWKPIKSFEMYAVSNLGRVKRLVGFMCGSERQRKIMFNAVTGYCEVLLSKDSKKYMRRIHTLVTEAFVAEVPKGLTVNHKDGDTKNNRVDNLEIMTYSENHRHAFRELGRKPMRPSNINKDQVLLIRSLYDSGWKLEPIRRHLESIGVTGATRIVVHKAAKRKTWKYLAGVPAIAVSI